MSRFQKILCAVGLHGWHGYSMADARLRVCESCGRREYLDTRTTRWYEYKES